MSSNKTNENKVAVCLTKTNKINKKKGDDNNGITAECKDMCPADECKYRLKNKLVHSLEKLQINGKKLEYCMVKEYSRPAAGKKIKSCELRTTDALINTCNYLVNDVFTRNDVDFMIIYEFLFDRFRAVRQDLVIQRCSNSYAIDMYKIMLRFYIYSDYKLCTSKGYDAYMNSQHLVEVLQLIVTNVHKQGLHKDNVVYLAIYLLYNLNDFKSILFLLKLDKSIREMEPLKTCLDLKTAYLQNNFVQIFRIYKKLPLMCQMAFHPFIPDLECQMLKVYNVSYSAKNAKYPIDNFLKITLLNDYLSLKKYSDLYLIMMDNESIFFSKAKTDEVKQLKREHLNIIDDILKKMDNSKFLLNTNE